jgi:hypothetical protein
MDGSIQGAFAFSVNFFCPILIQSFCVLYRRPLTQHSISLSRNLPDGPFRTQRRPESNGLADRNPSGPFFHIVAPANSTLASGLSVRFSSTVFPSPLFPFPHLLVLRTLLFLTCVYTDVVPSPPAHAHPSVVPVGPSYPAGASCTTCIATVHIAYRSRRPSAAARYRTRCPRWLRGHQPLA